jgi:hypothetical protein
MSDEQQPTPPKVTKRELKARLDALEKHVVESVGTRLEELKERVDKLEGSGPTPPPEDAEHE